MRTKAQVTENKTETETAIAAMMKDDRAKVEEEETCVMLDMESAVRLAVELAAGRIEAEITETG